MLAISVPRFIVISAKSAIKWPALSWVQLTSAPPTDWNGDIQCVTRWSKFGMSWRGEPLEPDHGGPARLLVPHLYPWKLAKWITRLQLLDADRPDAAPARPRGGP